MSKTNRNSKEKIGKIVGTYRVSLINCIKTLIFGSIALFLILVFLSSLALLCIYLIDGSKASDMGLFEFILKFHYPILKYFINDCILNMLKSIWTTMSLFPLPLLLLVLAPYSCISMYNSYRFRLFENGVGGLGRFGLRANTIEFENIVDAHPVKAYKFFGPEISVRLVGRDGAIVYLPSAVEDKQKLLAELDILVGHKHILTKAIRAYPD